MRRRHVAAIAGSILLALAVGCASQRSQRRTTADLPPLVPPWSPLPRPARPPNIAGRPLRSTQYVAFRLDVARLRTLLAPLSPAGDLPPQGVLLRLPVPDGTFLPVNLQADKGWSDSAAFFSGRSVDGRFRVLLEALGDGLHAVVFDGCTATSYIEPFREENETRHLTYVPEASPGQLSSACTAADAEASGADAPILLAKAAAWAAPPRTLRIAVGATSSYVSERGGVDGALTAIQSSLHRVGDILGREFAITLVPLSDTAQRRLLAPSATGQLTGTSAKELAGQNAAALQAANVPGADYDIGHVIFAGSGGYGAIKSVCGPERAVGASGSAGRTGDPFDVDVLAHELGHQLGALHTHNLDGLKEKWSSFEPGTGSTIMGYPGLSKPDNLQLHADGYYHADSLRRVALEVAACGTVPAASNRAPSIDEIEAPETVLAGQSFSVKAVASDPDGDPLLYSWEEVDRGPAVDAVTRPLFRSWCPTSIGTRELGARKDPLAADFRPGEELPTVPRTLRFVVTVRDGRGGAAVAPVEIKVDTTASMLSFLRRR